MAQSVKCLPWKHKDPGFEPQNMCKKLSLRIPAWGGETVDSGACWRASLAYFVSSRPEGTVSNKKEQSLVGGD